MSYPPPSHWIPDVPLAEEDWQVDTLDIAWAAGLFEGEGCVYAKPDKGRIRIATGLDSCDHDVLERFVSIVGVGRLYGPYTHRTGTKPYWKWKATGINSVESVYALFETQLGARRTAAFRTAFLAYWDQPPAWSRRRPGSNRGAGLCRPLPNHSATAPRGEGT